MQKNRINMIRLKNNIVDKYYDEELASFFSFMFQIKYIS